MGRCSFAAASGYGPGCLFVVAYQVDVTGLTRSDQLSVAVFLGRRGDHPCFLPRFSD